MFNIDADVNNVLMRVRLYFKYTYIHIGNM